MKPSGYFLMVVGVFLALFGILQLAWVIYTSPDPNPNPVGNGMLMTLCFYAGIGIFGLGGWMAGLFRWPLV
jgi:hypothetical protein